ncbi:universal stress protein [Rhodococcus hoagii]|nr:universal stress protein [Prescottella equi]
MQRREQLLVLQVLDDAGSDADREACARRYRPCSTPAESANPVGTADVRAQRGPRRALVDLVADSGAGLFVAGSKRMSPIGKFLLERSLQRILLEVDVPVLVVKEPQ